MRARIRTGTAIDARTPMIATTMSNSMSVNPSARVFMISSGRRRQPSPGHVDVQGFYLVAHDAGTDVEQLRGILLHPVRHLQRFEQRLTLDFLERDAGRWN